MSNDRFDDELLSAIIDGEADPASVASVEADTAASQRLAAMRVAVDIVGEEPPPATAERRQASIAAALGAASPAPEVTSLSAERATRRAAPNKAVVIAIAAALLFFVVAIPAVLTSQGEETVTEAASDAADTSLSADDAADSVEDAVAGDDEEAMEDDEEEAMEDDEEAMEDDEEEAMEDEEEAMEDDEEFLDAATDAAPESELPELALTLAERLAENPPAIPVTNDTLGIEELIALGALIPQYTIDDLIDAGVNPTCLDAEAPGVIGFGVVLLDADGTNPQQLVVIEFLEDGTTRIFEAEDCSLLG